MKKLYYIKCSCPGDHWICDVTDNILEANKLLQEHKEGDPRSKFKIIYSSGENEAVRTWFNYKISLAMLTFLRNAFTIFSSIVSSAIKSI